MCVWAHWGIGFPRYIKNDSDWASDEAKQSKKLEYPEMTSKGDEEEESQSKEH